jgi:preprotein translocase subunit SecG
MQNAILVLHLIICMVLVGAVLMQRSEGGALGMGGGGSGSLISGRGAADMMVNITSWVGGAFFVTSIVLAVMANVQPADRSVVTAPGERPGIQFNLPGFNKTESEPKAAAPTPLQDPTVLTPPSGEQAPAPEDAVIRAGPLEAAPTAPVGAAPRTPPPAAKTPAAGTTKAPVGAATPARTTPAPVGSQKSTASPAPMIPLPAATPTAPAAESEQPPVPAPAPERQKAGPDE